MSLWLCVCAWRTRRVMFPDRLLHMPRKTPADESRCGVKLSLIGGGGGGVKMGVGGLNKKYAISTTAADFE